MYCAIGWGILFGYMFSSLFAQHKIMKRKIFRTALQKDKSNPDLNQRVRRIGE